MKLLILTLALSISTLSFADDCTDANSNFEMSNCAAEEYAKQDKELNRQYALAMKKLDKEASSKLRRAQRAWLAFRDAQCDLEADELRGGTGASLVLLGCLGRMTEGRVNDLQDIVELR